MLITESKKYIQVPFDSEEELEKVVIDNYEFIFGPNSFFLPKALIRTADGVGTIPDGFAIDLAARRWFIVEAELLKHNVWHHIAPQVSKQIIASSQLESRKTIALLAIEEIKKFPEKFKELGIDEYGLALVINEILEKSPIIGLPIDDISEDLTDWANTLKNSVNIWMIRKFRNFEEPEDIIYELPEEHRPLIDTEDENNNGRLEQNRTSKTYNVNIADLIHERLLQPGEELHMSYKPRNGAQKKYFATIDEDGNFHLLGDIYPSPSYAAMIAMHDAGSDRQTVNGWISWRTSSGSLLSDLRDLFLHSDNRKSTNQLHGDTNPR